jgi:hypothetical protein
MNKNFNYYDAWQIVELECPKCDWKGKFDDGSVRYYQELMDCSCPRCNVLVTPILAIVSFPTVNEMLASGNPVDIHRAKKIEEFQQMFDSRKLANKEQLPAVDSTSFTLSWNLVETSGEQLTVIRHDDRVLFSEPALWEGYERFEQVAKIVREKYGVHVKDLVPTHSSELYLYGDVLSSPDMVETVRRAIFGGEGNSVPPAAAALQTISGSEQQLLPPQLQCPECAFENDNPENLAGHLIQSHSYSQSAAWYAAGQENERLYPRFRAPEGTFSVLGVDKTVPTGRIIATCSSLDEAIVAADDEAGSYPEISVHDDSGKALYEIIPKPAGVDKPAEEDTDGVKPRRVIIATMPKFRKPPINNPKFPTVPTAAQIGGVVAFLPRLEGIAKDEFGHWETPPQRNDNTIELGNLEYHPAVDAFVRACYDNEFVQSFDWVAWSDEAQRYLDDSSLISSADLATCIKLITTHLRKERFSEGHLEAMLRSGHIVAILRRLRQLAEGASTPSGASQ